jgi:hypothetical protein
MSELRAGAQSIWEGSGEASQLAYEAIREPEDPETFDEHLEKHDPLIAAKMRMNMVIKSFDNDILGAHINRMEGSRSTCRFTIFSAIRPSFTVSGLTLVVFLTYSIRRSCTGFRTARWQPTKIDRAWSTDATLKIMNFVRILNSIWGRH